MCQTRASNAKGKSKSTKLSTTSKAAGKAKQDNVSPLISEAEDSGSQMVGSSRKRKRTAKESSLISRLDFDQLPPALQKQFMRQALKQAKNASAEAEAGMYIFLICCETLCAFVQKFNTQTTVF